MGRFLLSRILWFVPNVCLLTLLLFCSLTSWLSSPSTLMLGASATPAAVAALNKEYGFDDPVLVQYARWLGNALTGDFSRSFVTQQTVSDMVFAALPVSMELGFLSVALAAIAAVGFNTMFLPKSVAGTGISLVSVIGLTIPTFVLGAGLVYVFAIELQWLPSSGWVPFWEDPAGHLLHLILPIITLSLYYFSAFTMIYRAEYSRISEMLYVRVAQAKGISRRRVSFAHVLPNAVLPIISYIGISLGHVMGGAVMTEVVYSLPGAGRVFVDAIRLNDYPVILAVGMVVLTLMMLANLLADLALAAINPQVRLAK